MFSSHRRVRSSSTPPSASALIAATSVYRPSAQSSNASLAAAAAGAALRQAPPSPPSEQPGNIPTKRMLQRRDSYSFVSSEPVHVRPSMQRRSSSGSMTERQFRKDRSPPPGQSIERPASVASIRSMPTTLRDGLIKAQKAQKPSRIEQQERVLSRGSLRSGSSKHTRSVSLDAEDASVGALAAARKVGPHLVAERDREYAESVGSYMSDLDSIAEDDAMGSPTSTMRRRQKKNVPPPPVQEEPSESSEDDDRRHRTRPRAASLPMRQPAPPREAPRAVSSVLAVQAAARSSSVPPDAARLAPAAVLSPRTSRRHSPPPRSVSPAKSALKHTACPPSPTQGAKAAHARVSFSDEDSVASFTNTRPPPVIESSPPPRLPFFGSIGRKPPAMSTEEQQRGRSRSPGARVVTISPPASDGDGEAPRLPKKSSLRDATPPPVHDVDLPEFNVIQPTPREEEEEKMLMAAKEPEPKTPEVAVPTASTAATAADVTDDTDNASLYSDALESLPGTPIELNAPAQTLPQASEPPIARTISETIEEVIPLAPTAAAAGSSTNGRAKGPPLHISTGAPARPSTPPRGKRIYLPPSPPLPPSPKPRTSKNTRLASIPSSSGTQPPRRRGNLSRLSSTSSSASTSSKRSASPPRQRKLNTNPSASASTSFRTSMRGAAPERTRLARRYSSDSSDDARPTTRKLGGFSIRSRSRNRKSAAAAAAQSSSAQKSSFRSRFVDSSDDEDAPPPPVPPVPPIPAATSPKLVKRQNTAPTAKTTAAKDDAPPVPMPRLRPINSDGIDEKERSKKRRSFWTFGSSSGGGGGGGGANSETTTTEPGSTSRLRKEKGRPPLPTFTPANGRSVPGEMAVNGVTGVTKEGNGKVEKKLENGKMEENGKTADKKVEEKIENGSGSGSGKADKKLEKKLEKKLQKASTTGTSGTSGGSGRWRKLFGR